MHRPQPAPRVQDEQLRGVGLEVTDDGEQIAVVLGGADSGAVRVAPADCTPLTPRIFFAKSGSEECA
ncbi:hypothetical protein, partial [Streptomyces spectabilis]|uniref:hypothetical protein n=1 Tax=Streptomyces spectabilis TaxID=68270 RepID=UPI0033E55233